jgi:hypothetical protein
MSEIERMKSRVYERQVQLQRDRELHKPSPNELMAENTPDMISSYDFWCDECDEDFSSPAYKTVHRLYGDPVVCYRTTHECGNDCLRLVSHKDHDPYYWKSGKIRRQRALYAQDVLQADDYGFRTLYGAPYREFEKEIGRQEEDIIRREREKGFKGLSLKAQEEMAHLRDLENIK